MSEVTRRDAIKLGAAGTILAVGAAAVQAAGQPVEIGPDWDCLKNMTGKNLLITLASGNAGGPGYYVPDGSSLPFRVLKTTKKMVYVAFEFGTNTLVRVQEFDVLHQSFPPSNCLVITAAEAAKRVKEEAAARTTAPAAPLPY